MICLLLFIVGGVQSNIQLSVGFRVCSIQCQFSVCSAQGVYCSVGYSPSVLFNVCSIQSTGCSPRVCHVHVMSRVHSLSVLCPCAVLNFNIPSTTEGHLKTKYNVRKRLKNPLIYQCTMTYFGMYVFLVGTHWGNIWGKFTTA